MRPVKKTFRLLCVRAAVLPGRLGACAAVLFLAVSGEAAAATATVQQDFKQIVRENRNSVVSLVVESNQLSKLSSEIREEVADIRESEGVLPKVTGGINLTLQVVMLSPFLALDYATDLMNLQISPTRRFEGTGFIVDPEGFVLTNRHVVAGADEVKIRLADRTEIKGRVVNRDRRVDIAVIKITERAEEPFPAVRFGDSDETEAGEPVLAMGNPLGLEQTVTTGIVSNARRMGPYHPYIQTDAAINRGNSGSPLFNARGEVIGMNTMMVAGAANIGFAIPSNSIVPVLDELKESGSKIERGRIGVQLRKNSSFLREEYGVKTDEGYIITDVEKGSEADSRGLRIGDVVTHLNGEPLIEKMEFLRLEATGGVGRAIRLRTVRGDDQREVELIIRELRRHTGEGVEKF